MVRVNPVSKMDCHRLIKEHDFNFLYDYVELIIVLYAVSSVSMVVMQVRADQRSVPQVCFGLCAHISLPQK